MKQVTKQHEIFILSRLIEYAISKGQKLLPEIQKKSKDETDRNRWIERQLLVEKLKHRETMSKKR